LIYNGGTHTLTDLATLFYANPQDTFANFQAISLDADGRILLSATDINPQTGLAAVDLLLTPTEISSDPLEVPAAEPGTLAIAVLAIAGVAAHQLRERRCRASFRAPSRRQTGLLRDDRLGILFFDGFAMTELAASRVPGRSYRRFRGRSLFRKGSGADGLAASRWQTWFFVFSLTTLFLRLRPK
jgi:hypothetical protein